MNEFEAQLLTSGYRRDSRGVVTRFIKNEKEYVTRSFSKTTNGNTVEAYIDRKKLSKLRLN